MQRVPRWLQSFANRSELGALVAELDWSQTSLGALDTWPDGLRTATQICLATEFPMLVVWGPELVGIYNDGYRRLLGSEKHPGALGTPAKAVWEEIWPIIEPRFAKAMAGEATWSEHQLLEMNRNGFVEECYFTSSYSPILNGAGEVGGVLDVAAETTAEIIHQRRLACLSGLARSLVSCTRLADVFAQSVATLDQWDSDICDAELYLRADGGLFRVSSSKRDDLSDDASHEAMFEALDSRRPVLMDKSWTPGFPAKRLALPVVGSDLEAVIVIGLSFKLPFDDGYSSFLELIASNIATALDTTYRLERDLGEQRHIANTLQDAMLSPASNLPTVAARYLPAVGNLSVGGDWYDVISLPGRRRALVLGDCVGQGLDAATAMGQLRSVSRSLLLDGNSPSEVLEAMDRFAASVEGAQFATMAVTIIDVVSREMVYSLAGHPPPLVVGPSGSRWLELTGGMPLAVCESERAEMTATLMEGDVLVLYTDGLVERRGEIIDVGLDRLRVSVESHFDEPVGQLADGLLRDLMTKGEKDDVALVVKRINE